MKILLANYRYFISGGPERYMFNLMYELERSGHDIFPFSIKYTANRDTEFSRYFASPLGSDDEVYFDQQGMDINTFFKTLSRLFYSREVEKKVYELVTDTTPDIAYVLHYLKKLSPSLIKALKRRNLPVIVRLSDYLMLCPQAHCIKDNKPCSLCAEGNLLPSIKYGCVKSSKPMSLLNALATWYHRHKNFFELIDAFVVTNDFMKEMMIQAGYSPEKIVCIPTFTNTEVFTPSENYTKENYITYIGRLEELKGIHILIDALGKLKQESDLDVVLKIAGTGSEDYIKKLEYEIDRYNLSDKVFFLGQMDEKALSELLGKSLVNIVPSLWYENLPNSVLESYACGTPVLASDIGSLKGCVRDNITGHLFETGNPYDLAEKIKYYCSGNETLKTIYFNAREEALMRYSATSHMFQLETLFKRFL